MKKFIFLAMAFGLAACQTGKTDVGQFESSDAETNYISIKIASANGGGTRSLFDEDDETTPNNEFDDGWKGENAGPDESEVKNVRFYFFDTFGDPAIVDYSTGKSYKDFNPDDDIFADGEQDLNNVEHILAATVIIQIKREAGSPTMAGFPSQVLAILNPPTEELKSLTDTPTLDEVLEYCNAVLYSIEDGFVMSNSVYADGTPVATVNTVPILEENIQTSATSAKEHPLEIYVERVVAKVALDVKLEEKTTATTTEGGRTIYKALTSDKEGADNKYPVVGKDGKAVDTEIYIEFLGWNVTATADNTYMIKHINPQWENNYITATGNLFNTAYEPWNYKEYFRSFWAINPDNLGYEYGNFETAQANSFDKTKYGNVTPYTYLPENAASSDSDYNKQHSQVIIAAQLVDSDGEPLEIAEYAGQKYLNEEEDNVAIKKVLLSALNAKYSYTTDAAAQAQDKFQGISEDDIILETKWETVEGDGLDLTNAPEGRYLVYATLTETAAGYTWYDAMPTEEDLATNNGAAWKTEHASTADAVKAALKALGSVKVWTGGKTYYYFDIRHLANPTGLTATNDKTFEDLQNETPGFYGVVRNHIYKCDITSIYGLGTPVFDPEEVIIPEHPQEEEVFLAAKINILSWRIVNRDYELKW